MPVYALAIFVSAFLLFQVQPLIGKFILPWFGGAPGVWTTCLLFFQCMLLAGYAYAHLVGTRAKPRMQVLVHLAVVAAAIALLPIAPGGTWKPEDGTQPALRIVLLLLACVGLPYFALSATGPLLQRWFSVNYPERSPYRLYALSNAGSLLALLSYPFYFEPHFTRNFQTVLWSVGFVLYAVLAAGSGLLLWRSGPRVKEETQDVSLETGVSCVGTDRPGLAQRVLWVLFPACASILLLATTNKICQDIAVIPFLWVVPLSVYLLSFIICFDSPRWYRRVPFTIGLVFALGALAWTLPRGTSFSMYKQVSVFSAALFACCMVCHGEVYRLRPHPRFLTGFYLAISAGGALGGLFVALLAPVLFNGFYELHWGVFMCGFLFMVVCVRDWKPARAQTDANGPADDRTWRWLACLLPFFAFGGLDRMLAGLTRAYPNVPKYWLLSLRIGMWVLFLLFAGSWYFRGRHRVFRHWRLLSCLWLALGLAGLGTVLFRDMTRRDPEVVSKSRNFYGTLTVYEHRRTEPLGDHYLLQHGGITHGLQFVDPDQRGWPTTYYGQDSGVGKAIAALPETGRRIGLVGLGTGTLASYGRAGDHLRIYEINPEILRLASSRFSYLANCPADLDVILGDARLSLEREGPQEYDLLALDAFSSDAIPVHLLTREAFALYSRHLKPQGILAVHVSNHYLDLEPVVTALAKEFGYRQAIIDYDELEDQWWLYASTWVLLSRDAQALAAPAIRDYARAPSKTNSVPIWTDDFASLYQILK